MSQKRRNQRGIALIWAALVIFVMIGIVGLSLDWGKLALNVHQLHNAADAGALAGALIVKFTAPAQTRQMAITLAHENNAEQLPVSVADNVANDPNGEVVIGRWIRQTREFIPTLLGPNAVKVRGNRPGQLGDPPLALIFGPVFNVQTANASRYAIATSIASTGAGIICLASDPSRYPGWSENKGTGALPGNGIVDLSGIDPNGNPIVGDWQVNATADEDDKPKVSFNVNGTKVTLNVGELNAVGTTNPDADDPGAWETLYDPDGIPFSVNPHSPAVVDPLIDAVPPDIKTMPAGTDTNGKVYGNADIITGGTLTLNPGYYPGGIQMSGGDITLNPGVYAFGGSNVKNNGPGFVIGGGAVRGNGVMVYVTGDPDGSKTGTTTKYGRIDIGGNGAVNIVSPGDALDPKQIDDEMGIALWQDRANNNYTKIIGGGDCDITGTIYCGYNAVEIGGTFEQMGNQIIAGALALNGDINLHVSYDGRNQIKAFQSMLVE